MHKICRLDGTTVWNGSHSTECNHIRCWEKMVTSWVSRPGAMHVSGKVLDRTFFTGYEG